MTPDLSQAGPPDCRAVRRDELTDALRLILSNTGRPAGDGQVADFLRFALQRDIDLNDLWVAARDGRIVWAALPILNPGRTMLLLLPDRAPTGDHVVVTTLLEAMCAHFAGRGVTMAQAMMEPGAPLIDVLARHGLFVRLAELIYLQGDVRRAPTSPAGDVRWLTYSPDTHDRFAETILQTYEDSLDCPALNGVRGIEDVIRGHKGGGAFRPDLWLLATDATDAPLGVLLLAQIPAGDAVELVYLGVRPEARGRRVGHALFREAMAIARALGVAQITLAVDAQNVPALRLYYGHGLHKICSKIAMMRDLRPDRRAPVGPHNAARSSTGPAQVR